MYALYLMHFSPYQHYKTFLSKPGCRHYRVTGVGYASFRPKVQFDPIFGRFRPIFKKSFRPNWVENASFRPKLLVRFDPSIKEIDRHHIGKNFTIHNQNAKYASMRNFSVDNKNAKYASKR